MAEAAQFLTDVPGLDDTVAAESAEIADALDGISQSASDRLGDLLLVMQEPFRELAVAHESGRTFQLDPSRFKAAGNEVIAVCTPLLDEPGSAESPPDTASFKVSADTTCQLLIGPNEEGPLLESILFITQLVNSNEQDLTPAHVETSQRLSTRLDEILETSGEDLRPYIEEVVKPLDMLAADDSTGIKVDMSTYKPAGIELIAQCS